MYAKSGIDENTFYKWLGEEGFKKHIEEAVSAHMMGENPKVIKALIEQCVKGNATALKIYFDLNGKNKRGADVSETSGVNIFDDVPAKVKRKKLSV